MEVTSGSRTESHDSISEYVEISGVNSYGHDASDGFNGSVSSSGFPSWEEATLKGSELSGEDIHHAPTLRSLRSTPYIFTSLRVVDLKGLVTN